MRAASNSYSIRENVKSVEMLWVAFVATFVMSVVTMVFIACCAMTFFVYLLKNIIGTPLAQIMSGKLPDTFWGWASYVWAFVLMGSVGVGLAYYVAFLVY